MSAFLSEPKTCAVLGCPVASGQKKCGVKLAPNILKLMGLGEVIENLGYQYVDAGNVIVSPQDTKKTYIPDDISNVPTGATAIDEESLTSHTTHTTHTISDKYYECGRINEEIHKKVYALAKQKKFVLNIGGDHGVACGTIAGMLREYPDLVVIWVDAHSDCNTTATSPSGNYHGMPAAHVMKWMPTKLAGFEWLDKVPPLKESHMSYIGLRSVDEGERQLIRNSDVTAFTIRDVDAHGISSLMKQVLQGVDPQGNRPIHLSFDIDACDPCIAPGTGTRNNGGLTYREVHYICQEVFRTHRLVSMDLVEINPLLDIPCVSEHGDREGVKIEATTTVRLGIELIATALGDTIL